MPPSVIGLMVWLVVALIVGGVVSVVKSDSITDWLQWFVVVTGVVFLIGVFLFGAAKAALWLHWAFA